MIKILHITPNFNYSCGRSKLVYHYLKYFGNHKEYETHFLTNGGDSLERLKEIPNLHYEILNFATGYKNIIHKNSFYIRLKDYVHKNKINMIHTHHRFPESISVRIGKEFNIKTITSAHSFVKGFKRSSFKSDRVISVSNSVADHLKDNYEIEKEKIITLYNPVEIITQVDSRMGEKFKNENNISSEQKIILFVGRLTKDKGYDILLNSIDIVSRKIKNLIIVICGQIDNSTINVDLLNVNIKYVPPQKDINHLYSIAEIVVLPSRIDPFPFVMLEAGTFKKPFIGGNTGGIAEFIEDGKNGLLVDPENPAQLAEKIIYLLDNPKIGQKLGENLHEKMNKLCDYNNYFGQVENIYNSLLTS